MAESHLFGDYFAEPEDKADEKKGTAAGVRIRPVGSHLFGEYFPEDRPAPAPVERVDRGFASLPPKPPISGATPEESAAINLLPSQQGGENPRRFSSIANLPRDLAREDIERTAAIPSAIAETFAGGKGMLESGLGDIMQGKIMPNTASTDPSQWEGGGLLKTAGGALGMVGAPIAGPIQELVQKPLTNITGNPAFGEKASLLVPGVGGPSVLGTAAKAVTGTKAIDALVDLVGPKNVPAAIERLKSNPNLRLGDVAPAVRTTVQGFADPAQPTALRAVRESADLSHAGNAQGARDAYTATLGPRPDALRMLDQIKNKAERVGKEQINPAIVGAKPVDLTPIISEIDQGLKPSGIRGLVSPDVKMELTPYQKELLDIRQKLTDKTGELSHVDANRIHEIQSELRRRAEDLSSSAVGSERKLGRELYALREKIIGQVDKASGGAYRPALTKYKDVMDIEDAFEKGLGVRKNREGIAGIKEDSPQALERWMANPKTSIEERDAFKAGALESYHRKIDSMKYAARAGSDIPDVEFNLQKMKIIFGEERAKELQRKMKDVKDIAETNSKWVQGSKTAETQAAQRAFAIPEVGKIQPHLPLWPIAGAIAGHESGIPYLGTAAGIAGLGLGVGKTAVQKAQQISALSRNAEMARLSGATGVDRADLIAQLMSHPKVTREIKKIGRGGIPSQTP